MATMMHIDGMSLDYPDIALRVLKQGEVTSPRGLETRELTNVLIHINDPCDSLPVGTNRGLNLAIGAVEALQLIGAVSNPGLVLASSANFGRFMEPSGTFYGSYGERVGSQVHHVVRKLREDPDTRQAVITLWNPTLDNDPGHRDYPCTVALGFRIRQGQLDCTVTMRSNDVWLGLPYDVFQFTQLQISIAHLLHIEVGHYDHFTYSLHVYAEHYENIEKLHPGTKGPLMIDGIGSSHEDEWREVQQRAAIIANGGMTDDMTVAEVWFMKQVQRVLTSQR